RMMLSEQGLPTHGSVGWEIFDKTDALGQTSFVQNINKVRALEGELQRSIDSMSMVKNARVHLNIPDRTLFEQSDRPTTASVILSLRTGGKLPPQKVHAVQNFIASAVPGLTVDHISVVDDQMNPLATSSEGGDGGLSGAGADERKVSMEQAYRQKIMEIVENIAGPGAAKVTVSLDVDFNKVTQNEEKYDPDSKVLRSSTTSEEQNKSVTNEPQPGDAA